MEGPKNKSVRIVYKIGFFSYTKCRNGLILGFPTIPQVASSNFQVTNGPRRIPRSAHPSGHNEHEKEIKDEPRVLERQPGALPRNNLNPCHTGLHEKRDLKHWLSSNSKAIK